MSEGIGVVMNGFWKFVDEAQPERAGWYAVLICWEAWEGFSPGAAYWDGENWGRTGVASVGQAASSEAAAEKLARDNDPNW